MTGRIVKSTIVQMIGYFTTYASFQGLQPVAIGFFIAVWCSRLIRFPLFPIISVGMFLSSGLLAGAKYALVLFTIMFVFYIMEGAKSRVPIIRGAITGGSILYVMELTDIYMSGGDRERIIMTTAATVLTISLSIVFYKILEIIQLPRGRERANKDKDDYKETLNSYKERVNSMSDAFAKMARNIEKTTEDSELFDVEQLNDESCECCKILKRQNQIYKSKLLDSRRVLATQLIEMSNMLGEGLGDTYDLRGITKEQMRILTGRMRDAGLILQKIVRLDNRRGISEIIVTMKARKGKCVSVREATRIINLVFDKDVELVKEKRRVIGNDMATYRFKEKPNFFVLHGLAKASLGKVSGDNFSCRALDTGQTFLGISDGMGSGIEACKDSEMVLELIENLIESGFSEETALRLINTLFVLDGENAAPATVDMGIIDMYSGMCDFMKLGAASTYVKRGDWVEALKSTSLPIGGSDQLDIESTKKKLYDGDFVIMMSDGLVETAAKQDKEDMIGKIILEADQKKPQDMANHILRKVIDLLGGEKEDDMTVFVTGIWNYGKCVS